MTRQCWAKNSCARNSSTQASSDSTVTDKFIRYIYNVWLIAAAAAVAVESLIWRDSVMRFSTSFVFGHKTLAGLFMTRLKRLCEIIWCRKEIGEMYVSAQSLTTRRHANFELLNRIGLFLWNEKFPVWACIVPVPKIWIERRVTLSFKARNCPWSVL